MPTLLILSQIATAAPAPTFYASPMVAPGTGQDLAVGTGLSATPGTGVAPATGTAC